MCHVTVKTKIKGQFCSVLHSFQTSHGIVWCASIHHLLLQSDCLWPLSVNRGSIPLPSFQATSRCIFMIANMFYLNVSSPAKDWNLKWNRYIFRVSFDRKRNCGNLNLVVTLNSQRFVYTNMKYLCITVFLIFDLIDLSMLHKIYHFEWC